MLPNGSFDNGVQVLWDSTSIQLAQACPRKYYYTMIEQVAPRIPSVHLRFGALYATALEHYYKHRYVDGISHEEALLLVVREAMIETWSLETNSPEIFPHNAKTRPNLIRTIIWYLDQFHDEETLAIHRHLNGDPAVEVSFKLPIEADFALAGHLDRVVNYSSALYVMDQKTTGTAISAYYFKDFKPSTQMGIYTYAGQVIFQTPVKGVIIDAAQVAVSFTRFGRGFVTWSAEELDEFLDSITHTVRMTQHFSSLPAPQGATLERNFPMNPTACGNYGGCAFREVCSSPARVRKGHLDAAFTQKVWDPSISR